MINPYLIRRDPGPDLVVGISSDRLHSVTTLENVLASSGDPDQTTQTHSLVYVFATTRYCWFLLEHDSIILTQRVL